MQTVLAHIREQGRDSCLVTLGSAERNRWLARDGMLTAVKAANEELIKGIGREESCFGVPANSVLVP